ncbi:MULTISPECIES: diguanylate cyclase [unclassified Treponema]|uniref:diguanylate cyclase n=1 Tax=unclassified Treponema TaxID=2638727 RepID=UPI0020A2790F|nr:MULTISPECIES: diguanylate cyclase [unclassified Treponema]UTC66355.1 diguanylate cyclase [Treponema sp. OMZ 789]UTC69085.1 diguanylate cyclase [Treponema sp. OMZ 790]UTC71797.1 diguanylate cyclase [Treponema sp. OMZ 791]
MKILNNRYRIIKEIPFELKNEGSFIVEDLDSRPGNKLELRLIYASALDEDFMEFIREKFILIKQLKETVHIKNYDFTRLISIDDKTVDELIYLYTTEHIDEKEPILDFLVNAKPEEIFSLFAEMLKELNYLITYGIVYNNFDLNNMYVIKNNGRIFIKAKDLVTEKNQYPHQISLLSNNEIHTFSYNHEILKTIILSLLLKKNIIKNHEKYFQELTQTNINHLKNEKEKELYTCFFKIYNEINARKLKQEAYPFYEIISDINYNINADHKISTPMNIVKNYQFPLHREKEKKEIFSVLKQTKAAKLENKNILITGPLGIGKTFFLSELHFLLLLENIDVYYIPSLNDMDDIKFILYLMKSLFLKNSLIQKNNEKELNTILNTLKHEMEINEDITRINALKYKLINLIAKLIIENTASQSIVFIIDDIHLINEFITKTILYITIENSDKKNIILIQSVNESLINNNQHTKKLIKTLSNQSTIKKINLQNLSQTETEILIRNTVNIRNVPEILLKKIHLNTAGNPLFINEALKELTDSDELKKDSLTELCMLSTNLSNPSIPIPISANIQQAVGKQIKELNKNELNFLKDLCIFHSSFKAEILPEILNTTDETVKKYIPKFLDQNIIKKTTKQYTDEYSIINKILQKTLYNELDYSYRMEIHKKIMQRMKKIKSFNIHEFVWHAEKAELFEEAVNYCIKHKNKIKKQCTHIAYIDIFEKIYTLIPNEDNDRKLDILLILADSYIENDNLIGCSKQIETAEKIIKKCNSNKTAAAQLHIIKAIQEIHLKSKPEKIAKSLALAEEFTAEANDIYTQLFFDKARVAFLQYKKNYIEAIDEAKKIIVKCGNLKEFKSIKTKVLLDLANNLFYSGQYKEAEKTYLETLKNAKKIGNTNIEDTIFNNLAIIQEQVYKNFNEAIVYYTKILKNSNASGNTISEILALMNLSITYSHFYDYENAYNICNQAIKKIMQNFYTDKMFFAHSFMYEILLAMCMYDKAAEFEIQIIKMLKNKNITKDPLHISAFKQTKNTFYYAMGDFNSACENFDKNVDGQADVKDILNLFSSFCVNLNKIAQGKVNSPEKLEEDLTKLISHPIVINNIYLLFYELIYCIRKIIIFRYDIDFKKMLKILLGVKCNSNHPLIKAHLLFLEAYIEPENAEKKLIEAASLLENKYMLDLSIDINIKLGLIYLRNENINMAMLNLIEAQKLVNIFMKKIPPKFKKTYFNAHHYGLPSLIIDDYINKKIKPNYKEFLGTLSYEQIKKLLSKNTVEKLKNNPAFILNIIAQTKASSIFKNKSIDDIIEKFTDDFLQNIKELLNFTALNLLANSADVFITTNENKIESLFNFGQNKTIEKIARLIESSTYKAVNIKTDGEVSSHLVIPINYHTGKQTGNTTTGYLVFVSNKEINNFGNFGIGFCLSIENIFAFLIESYKAQQEAATDKLTSALTRKYTEYTLKELLKVSDANNKSFAVLMYDLDKFKKINDTLGHQTGDTVLKAAAKTVLGILKKEQVLGRVGGEEFIVLLPDTEKEQAFATAEKIRKQIEALHFDTSSLRVTISIGIAVFPKHGSTEKDLLAKADQALYAAKKWGRNQTVIWKEDLEPAKKKADRLAGILTGNSINDTKNILSFIDTASLIRRPMSKTKRLELCLEKIIESTGADSGIFVCPIMEKKAKHLFNYKQIPKADFPINRDFIIEVMSEKKELCKIDWENISGKSAITGVPNWNSAILVPVILRGEIKAIIYLVVGIRKRKFGTEELNLTNLFAGLIAPFF